MKALLIIIVLLVGCSPSPINRAEQVKVDETKKTYPSPIGIWESGESYMNEIDFTDLVYDGEYPPHFEKLKGKANLAFFQLGSDSRMKGAWYAGENGENTAGYWSLRFGGRGDGVASWEHFEFVINRGELLCLKHEDIFFEKGENGGMKQSLGHRTNLDRGIRWARAKPPVK